MFDLTFLSRSEKGSRTMTTAYTVPGNPADAEAAALELIVQVPGELLGHDSPPTAVLLPNAHSR